MFWNLIYFFHIDHLSFLLYHQKTLKKSYLENIDGIGAKKAKSLLSHFKTLGAIKEATADELVKVKGISMQNANDIIEFLKEYK